MSLIEGKTILITGGTGSFGKKFTEIVLREYHPKKLIIFSRDELKQHEMRRLYPDGNSPMRYLGCTFICTSPRPMERG
jgi:UDP-N-acetylglucosamine 4,6-dehydratase/5-epimerase